VLTRRVLKLLEDEQKRDMERYDSWYESFNQFLKEGLMMDAEHKEQLLKLMRYSATFSVPGSALVGLDDYVKKMKAGQQKIYYVAGQSKEGALGSPFMEPFKQAGENAPPLLILTNGVDEVLFSQIGEHKGHRFVNIETASYDELAKDLGLPEGTTTPEKHGLPEEDVATFSLWLKNELRTGKVSISKRLKEQPAVLFSQVSS
jgi:HSP90 family molecular chaperone